MPAAGEAHGHGPWRQASESMSLIRQLSFTHRHAPHPLGQVVQRVALAVARAHAQGGPATDLVHHVGGALDGAQAVAQRVAKRVHHQPFALHVFAQPKVQSGAGVVGVAAAW